MRADPARAAEAEAAAAADRGYATDGCGLAPMTPAEFDALVAHHKAHLRRLAANFAVAADAALLLGGRLK